MRAAILNAAFVVTAIEDWGSAALPSYVIPSATANVGDTWNGSSFVAGTPVPPTADEQLAAQIAMGIVITSTANPSTLSGTYGVDPTSTANISGIAAGIGARNRLPGGGTTFAYGDMMGGMHNFGASDFLNFADVVEDYCYALYQQYAVALQGGTPAWPANTATIP